MHSRSAAAVAALGVSKQELALCINKKHLMCDAELHEGDFEGGLLKVCSEILLKSVMAKRRALMLSREAPGNRAASRPFQKNTVWGDFGAYVCAMSTGHRYTNAGRG